MIEDVIVAMAYGDSMGMPSELWSRAQIKGYFGEITKLLDGPLENKVAKNYKAGMYTDDSAQALVVLDTLIENEFKIEKNKIAQNLVNWAKAEKAWENNILGPTSKIALQSYIDGVCPNELIAESYTNGAAMRIAPIGILFESNQQERLVDFVCELSSVTHISDVCLSGACMIAQAVSSSIDNKSKEQILADIYQVEQLALPKGIRSFNPSIAKRVEYGLREIENHTSDQQVLEFIYNVIGSGVHSCESVSAALIISMYAKDVKHCALLCANLGGDTDTIGAMACAICGAMYGTKIIGDDYSKIVETNNIKLNYYVNQLNDVRGNI